MQFVNPTHERDALSDVLSELRIFVPALSEALARDAGAPEGERVTTSASLSLPVNADVMGAYVAIDSDVLGAVQRAAETAGEAAPTSRVAYALDHAQRLHERLLVLGNPPAARHLYDQIHSALITVKRALGFLRPDVHLGAPCPLHDDPLTELVTPGAVGTLTYERLDKGVPVNPAVSWQYNKGFVRCRFCEAVWAPSQQVLLQRMIADADRRRIGGVGHDGESVQESEEHT